MAFLDHAINLTWAKFEITGPNKLRRTDRDIWWISGKRTRRELSWFVGLGCYLYTCCQIQRHLFVYTSRPFKAWMCPCVTVTYRTFTYWDDFDWMLFLTPPASGKGERKGSEEWRGSKRRKRLSLFVKQAAARDNESALTRRRCLSVCLSPKCVLKNAIF